jgi:GNAT superfamily N-acetyltransferase
MNPTIRAAHRGDVPTILRFIQALAEYERLSHEVVATEESLAQTLFGPRPEAEVVLIEVEGVAAGFALFFHNYSTFLSRRGLYLEDLFVLPEFRGRGLGKALLLHLAKIAVERNCGRFEWTALEWNTPAIRFYESLGASLKADWRIFRVTGDGLTAMARRGEVPEATPDSLNR